MGRIRNYLFDIFTKATETFDSLNASKDHTVNTISQPMTTPPEPEYIMPNGIPFTPEEKLENNKLLIETLDSNFLHIVNVINELYPDENIVDEIASNPQVMRIWLAHVIHRDKILKFRNIITTTSSYQKTKQKKIKCLQDLPLQKMLLN
jgi:hypothetical protein